MAALLKKRALAEYTSQVLQEEQPKPIKKLRLIQRPAEPEVQLNLQGLNSHEALQALLKFENSLPVGCNVLCNVVRELVEHYGREKEAVVRGTIANILGKLSKIPGISAENLVDELIPLLKAEESHKTKSQLLAALCVVGKSASLQKDLHIQLVDIARQNLTDSSHLIRSSCLDLIGCLESHDQYGNEAEKSAVPVLKLLEGFTKDQDPRVRSSAFQAMLQLHSRGMKLDQGIYKESYEALTDDYEGVRLAAVQLVWVLSHLFPESMVPVPGSDEEIRLIDDGFVKICNMMNDISVKVRTKAASLLGSLHQVSPKFLEQTLDKKLMSNMRRKKTGAERAKDNFQSGGWSSGQKWADDAPKEELDPDDVNLMNIGACGAFVHGLEDEYSEVRNTTLDSLCELASQSLSFAMLSQDSITDMFNDEIESVRLNAINSLKKLSQYLEIREDQLEIMLGVLQVIRTYIKDWIGQNPSLTTEFAALEHLKYTFTFFIQIFLKLADNQDWHNMLCFLISFWSLFQVQSYLPFSIINYGISKHYAGSQDFSYTSRESLRDMLCEMKLATKECLNACVFSLLDNLKRYPEDRVSIWKCMQFLGRNNPNLALPLMPEFLCLHPYFDTPEPEMDDPAYISILVLVFNAAAGNRTALPMFQEHTWRHYSYLRDSIPNMVPDLKHTDAVKVLDKDETISKRDTSVFLRQTVSQLENISNLDNTTAKQMLETTVRDLQRVTELDMKTSASAECICLFLQSQLLITQLLSQHAHILTGSVTVNNLNVLVDKILSITNKLQTLFLGLGNNEVSLIKQIELKALTFKLGSTLANSQELATQMKAQEAFVTYLTKLQRFLSSSDSHTSDKCTAFLISELAALKSQQLSSVQRVLHNALKLVRPTVCPVINKIRKGFAVILEPARVSDNPIKFTAGLTTAVLLIAEIENVEDTDNLRIQVKYPDTNTDLIIPTANDLKRQSLLHHRLTTNVILSHGHWSESCQVEIGLVLLSSATQMKFKSQVSSDDQDSENVIELCQPVKVLISPKPHKR